MNRDEQLDLWIAGDPRCPNGEGNCCPDFSCCNHDLLQPVDVRREYKRGSKKKREQLEFAFLQAALAHIDRKVFAGSLRR
jgi:hypothetical protein